MGDLNSISLMRLKLLLLPLNSHLRASLNQDHTKSITEKFSENLDSHTDGLEIWEAECACVLELQMKSLKLWSNSHLMRKVNIVIKLFLILIAIKLNGQLKQDTENSALK